MRIHQFDLESAPSKPWKNGAGATCELACWPPDAGFDAFGWRVSIATIAASGPFSEFEGVDRTIMLLSGDGVRLSSSDGAVNHRLESKLQPFAFPGEAAVVGELLGTQSRDFNVMTRRSEFSANTKVLAGAAMLAPTPFGLLFASEGSWRATAAERTYCVAAGGGLWWEEGEESGWTLAPLGAEHGTLIAVGFSRGRNQPAE